MTCCQARGVQPHRDSANVDVLVRASDLEPLIHEVGRHGRRWRPELFAHHALVQHSVTLLHPSWPCDLALPVSYPGFLADPDLVFEALRSRREALTVGGTPIDGPNSVGSVLIAALHSLGRLVGWD